MTEQAIKYLHRPWMENGLLEWILVDSFGHILFDPKAEIAYIRDIKKGLIIIYHLMREKAHEDCRNQPFAVCNSLQAPHNPRSRFYSVSSGWRAGV